MNYRRHLADILRLLLDNEKRIREAAACDLELEFEGIDFDINAGWCEFVKAWAYKHEYSSAERNLMFDQLANFHDELFDSTIYPVCTDPEYRVEEFMSSSPLRMWAVGDYAEDRWSKLRQLVNHLEVTCDMC